MTQPEFAIVATLDPVRKPVTEAPPLIPAVDPLRLNAILLAENITLSTLSIMLAVLRCSHGSPVRLSAISKLTGFTTNAVRQQIHRTPWWSSIFLHHGRAKCEAVILTANAKTKLERIKARLK